MIVCSPYLPFSFLRIVTDPFHYYDPFNEPILPMYLHLFDHTFLLSFFYSFSMVSNYSGGLLVNLRDSLLINPLNDLLVSLPHNPVPLLHGVEGWLGKEAPTMC